MVQSQLMEKMRSDAQWELKTAMQKEIGIMREILANMRQEEMSLTRQDKATWTIVMQDRFFMIQRLSFFRNARIEATAKVEMLSSLDKSGEKRTIEEILPEGKEEECEILLLLDQILALTDRMNKQNILNETLSQKNQQSIALSSSFCYDDPIPQLRQSKNARLSVAVYPSLDDASSKDPDTAR